MAIHNINDFAGYIANNLYQGLHATTMPLVAKSASHVDTDTSTKTAIIALRSRRLIRKTPYQELAAP